ncbi:MAG: glycoside hydrolase family 125 protein [Gordonia sp. (in: high G+C Gram-positive bacteria)]|uniref:glycoside hydrolase family 125 protein n=1 Tax=Gordonia sp. (in: high G+C Gram-positive bacteria) TaxID=84139 RepID=UPI0039E62F83
MPVIDPAVPGDRPDPDELLPPDVLSSWTERVTAAAGEPCGALFSAAMRRTLDRTLHRLPDGTVFVITGDIPAMWLRDSATQMRPYLTLLGKEPSLTALADMIAGVVRRQMAFLTHDAYANAFNAAPNGNCHEPRDSFGDGRPHDPWIWERKYEIDSLCFPFQLADQLTSVTGRTDHLDDETFGLAARAAVGTLDLEIEHEKNSIYRFVRPAPKGLGLVQKAAPHWHDMLPRKGLGSPVAVTGMTWSGFRPSDDPCEYGYLVPSNLMAAHTLDRLCALAKLTPTLGDAVPAIAAKLAGTLRAGIAEHGVIDHAEHGKIWAYEVDGLGNVLAADDANMPSLLSAPLVAGIDTSDPMYRRTREFVLSADNPYYVSGRLASGAGSPHTPSGYVWPIALAVAGLTADDPGEALHALQTIAATTAGTGSVHESFDVNDDRRFTRDWFSWADSMFCELALSVASGQP